MSVTELKNKLGQYLRRVKQGEIVEILERSIPIARVHGVQESRPKSADHLDRLVRDGIVSPAVRNGRDLLKSPPIRSKLDPVKILIEERGDR